MFKTKIAAPAMLLASLFVAPTAFSASDAEVAKLEKRIKALETANRASASRMNAIIESQERLSINGFITAGVSTANSSFGTSQDHGQASIGDATDGNADYVHYQKDQKFGLQFAYQLGESTDIVTQVVGRAIDNEYEAHMEWAYLGHVLLENKGPLESLKMRVGKAPVATYIISEYFDVGVAYPWVDPPFEVYSTVGGAALYGFDFQANWVLPGDWGLNTQFYLGENDIDPRFGEGDVQDFQDIWGYNFNFYKDAWAFRYGSASTKVELDSVLSFGASTDPATFGALGATGAISDYQFAAQALNSINQGFADGATALAPFGVTFNNNQVNASNVVPATFSGVGVSYDDGTYLMYAEMTNLDIEQVQPNQESGYLTLGYHIGDFTPYISYAWYEEGDSSDATDILAEWAALEAQLRDPALAATINGAALAAAITPTQAGEALAGIDALLITLTGDPTDSDLTGALPATGAVSVESSLAQNAGLQAISDRLLEIRPQETYTIGTRYDFTPGAAVKLEFQQVTGLEGKYTDEWGNIVEEIYISKLSFQAAF